MSFMLENLSGFYKREVEETVSALTKAMEPTVIFVVAGIVGTIVISLYLGWLRRSLPLLFAKPHRSLCGSSKALR